MKKKILVIDDDALVLKSVWNLLIREGFEVERAKNGDEAASKVQAGTFSLIICDIRMPGQDGISVARNLKQIWQKQVKPETPIIFVTGYASEEVPIEAVKLGAKDYLLKPFNLDELLQSIRQHIS